MHLQSISETQVLKRLATTHRSGSSAANGRFPRRQPGRRARLLPQLWWGQQQSTPPGLVDEWQHSPPRVWSRSVQSAAGREVESYELNGKRREVPHGVEQQKGQSKPGKTCACAVAGQLSAHSKLAAWLQEFLPCAS